MGAGTFDEALALIDARVAPLERESVPLAEAAGRTLAAPLLARADAPPVATSAMDGYAVIHAATQPGVPLVVIGESRPGARFAAGVSAGQAVRIFTGAALPPGADCVIMQEYAERSGAQVRFAPGYGPARYVRAAASDFAAGDMLLPAGTWLSPRAMVAAAAADRAELLVVRRPCLAILSTGDELAAPGMAYPTPGLIPDSVSFGVAALAQEAGAAVVHRQRGGDELPQLKAMAAEALAVADVIVITGGASVGERDFAKAMLADAAPELLFATLAIKPGKPVWCARARGRWVLGLPGNPTSAMVTATLFLRPLLARLLGRSSADMLEWRSLPLAAALPATDARETFTRAVWRADGLHPLAHQGSDAQAVLAQANWLIRCPAGQAALPKDTMVRALAF